MNEVYNFNVAGVSHKTDNVKIAYSWYLSNKPIQVVFKKEPDNKYDENAIAIYLKYNEEKVQVGYLPKKMNETGDFWEYLANGYIIKAEVIYMGSSSVDLPLGITIALTTSGSESDT